MNYDDYPGTYEDREPRPILDWLRKRPLRTWLRNSASAIRRSWLRLRRLWRPRRGFSDHQPELASLLIEGHARGGMVIRFDEDGYAYEDKTTLSTSNVITVHQENQPPIPIFEYGLDNPATWVGIRGKGFYATSPIRDILLEKTATVLEELRIKAIERPLTSEEQARQAAAECLRERYSS